MCASSCFASRRSHLVPISSYNLFIFICGVHHKKWMNASLSPDHLGQIPGHFRRLRAACCQAAAAVWESRDWSSSTSFALRCRSWSESSVCWHAGCTARLFIPIIALVFPCDSSWFPMILHYAQWFENALPQIAKCNLNACCHSATWQHQYSCKHPAVICSGFIDRKCPAIVIAQIHVSSQVSTAAFVSCCSSASTSRTLRCDSCSKS